jgi:predicted regulator of Ras-like GTPase activity (Roadblock/LC7/MglB family)
MKAAIAPLSAIPGVSLAMLVSEDGVPIVVRGDARPDRPSDRMQETRIEDADALAALAAGWISDLHRAAAPISWSAPRYLVLRAARGSLLAMQVPRALLIVVIGPGMRPADYRLSMEAAVARMERGLRANAQRPIAGAAGESSSEPAGIFPDRNAVFESEAARNDVAKKNGLTEPYRPIGE